MPQTWPTGLDLKVARLGATRPFGLIRQADVARFMGVTRSRVSQIETMETVRLTTARRFTDALGKALEAHVNG